MPPPTHPALADQRLGPFLLQAPLGEGRFARVWLATEQYGTADPIRTAAVKIFLLGSRASDATQRDAVLAEARALCKVEHPNVVRFFSLVVDDARGLMGLAMEHVAGTSLARTLEDAGRLPVETAIDVGIAVASALEAVHRATLVHRDVKPSNVVDAAGIYKLIDFGIAAADALPASPSRLTLPLSDGGAAGSDDTVELEVRGGAAGTPGYADPECERGQPAAAASDLYALGATLYQLIAGQVPARIRAPAGHRFDDQIRSGSKRAAPLLAVAPRTPPQLAELIDELVRPARRDRPVSAENVALRLQDIRDQLHGRAPAILPIEGPFRGLGRFEDADRGVYFGRRNEVAAALEALRGHGLVALVGPSGSGKSSLARAGVLPAVKQGALGGWPQRWEVAAVEPGRDPRAAVAAALASGVRRAPADALDVVLQGLAATSTPDALIEALANRARSESVGLVLLVDQLEQLDAVPAGESRDWLVALLARLGERPAPGLRALVTLRHDHFDKILAIPALGRAAARGLVQVEPMAPATWEGVLGQALLAYGYTFEDELLHGEIVAGISKIADKMTLVQFALTQLWMRRDPIGKRITHAALGPTETGGIGGIEGALDLHAEAVLARACKGKPEIGVGAARAFFMALTRPDGTRATRSAQELRDEAGDDAAVLSKIFEEASLLERTPGGDHALAHDTLITSWKRLRRWVDEGREDRLLAAELEHDAARSNATPELARWWQDRQLWLGESLRARGTVRLSPRAIEFLESSQKAAETVAVNSRRVQEMERRRTRSRRVGFAALGGALAGAASFALVASLGWQGAKREANDLGTIIENRKSAVKELETRIVAHVGTIAEKQKAIDTAINQATAARDEIAKKEVQLADAALILEKKRRESERLSRDIHRERVTLARLEADLEELKDKIETYRKPTVPPPSQ